MNDIYNIKYIDAYYLYDKECPKTELSIHEAYGYLQEYNGSLILEFIKNIKSESGIKSNDHKSDILKGLIIPEKSVFSVSQVFKILELENMKINSKVSIKWSDVVYIANQPIRECSIMETVGIIEKIGNDHLVIKDPDTKRIYPLPDKKHPDHKPTYYVIPKSLIIEIKNI